MARNDDGFVDISSSSDVEKVYHNSTRGSGPSKRTDKNGLKKRRKKLNLTIRIVTLVLSILLLLGGSLCLFIYYYLDANGPRYKALPATKKNNTTETTVSISGQTALLEDDDVLNILLFGQDAKGSADDYGRSDTTILLSIDNIHKKIKLTSFQRDTYVSIPGYGDDKINAAFTLGGEGLSIDTIEANFGVKVDKYATVDFKSFRKVIEAIGGIDMELNLEEIEYINAQIDVNHQKENGKTDFLEYDKTKELQTLHLNGYQALWYARDRGADSLGGISDYSFSGDDWDRTQRQRKLIETVIKHLKTKSSLSEMVAVVNEIGPYITTNLKKDHILYLASHALEYVKYDMEEMSIPTQGSWSYGHTSDGQSVIVINDWDKVRYDLAKFIYDEKVQTQSTESSASAQ